MSLFAVAHQYRMQLSSSGDGSKRLQHFQMTISAAPYCSVERALYRDGPAVILDSGNGIKGYRYELWCIARAAGVRFCLVHCDAPPEDARRWNAARGSGGGGAGDGDGDGVRGETEAEARGSVGGAGGAEGDFLNTTFYNTAEAKAVHGGAVHVESH
jgi:hypothetical protein